MATALTLLNNVLRGLRRDAVTTVSTTDAYHLFLIQLLNRAKTDAETSWDWQALRQTLPVTTSAGTYEYTVAGANAKSRLLYQKPSMHGGNYESSKTDNQSKPQVFDVTDSQEFRLTQIPWEEFEMLHLTDNDEQVAKPTHFALKRTSSGITMGLYPTPSGARTIKARFVVPQSAIPAKYMTNYTLKIPEDPIWMRALQYAIEDRGEGVGRRSVELRDEADLALYLAIEPELTPDDKTVNPV